jgi:hypothetical protein
MIAVPFLFVAEAGLLLLPALPLVLLASWLDHKRELKRCR